MHAHLDLIRNHSAKETCLIRGVSTVRPKSHVRIVSAIVVIYPKIYVAAAQIHRQIDTHTDCQFWQILMRLVQLVQIPLTNMSIFI